MLCTNGPRNLCTNGPRNLGIYMESGGTEVKLHQLESSKKAVKQRRRVGRGIGSGRGKTCGRGQKGQKSRSGGGKGPGFEGGQNPLQRRLPKLPGFKNPNKLHYKVVNVARLQAFKSDSVVDPESLYSQGVVSKKNVGVKILGDGKIEKPLTVRAHAFSKKATQKIKKAGGKVEVIK